MRREDLAPAELPVFRIPTGAIDVPLDRLRSLKPLQADAIGAAIKADRQYDPISVAQLPGSDRFVLVDGLHRLEGFRLHDMPLIDARIVPADRLGRLRQEISSAWARADHDVFDRAAQIAALAKLARDEDPLQCIATTLRWDVATAEALDVSPRTIRNYVTISEHFDAADIAQLRRSGLASDLVPLLRLAALPPEDFAAAMLLLEQSEVASIAEALARLSGTETIDPISKKNAAFFGHFAKRENRQRADFIRQLLDQYHPDGRPKASTKAARA